MSTRRLIEVEQKPDGRWVVSPSDASDRLVVPASVIAQVRSHAEEVHEQCSGFESLGVLVCDGDRVLRYTRLHNPSRRAGEFRLDARRLNRRDYRTVPLHSHPLGPAVPSPEDVDGARWDVAGIYSLTEDRLTLWQTTRPTWTEVEWSLAP